MIVERDCYSPTSRREWTEYCVRCVCGKESEPRGSKPMALTLAAIDGFVHVEGQVHHCRDCAAREAA